MAERYGDGDDSVWIKTQAIVGTTPVPSNIIDLRRFEHVALQLITTGTITGTWLIEASNDYTPAGINSYGEIAANAGTWSDVTALFVKAAAGTAIANPAGAATNQPAWPKDPLSFRALRITMTPASGAGNVTVLGYAKSWSS